MSKALIYYHDDLDGLCSAAIMNQFLQQKTIGYSNPPIFIKCNHKDDIDISSIDTDDTVAVLDFSFKPEIMTQVKNKAREVIWCDHHVSAKDYNYNDLAGYRDFSNKGLSGCECTWKYCFPNLPTPSCVEMIGDYDTWRLRIPDSINFFEGLMLNQPMKPYGNEWLILLSDSSYNFCRQRIESYIYDGTIALETKNRYCKEILLAFGYETEISGYKAYALNIQRIGSKAFGNKIDTYPICISFIFDGNQYTVSLYSTQVNVAEIAKTFGGGGHVGAAGFVCRELPFKKNLESR
jgi:oligoribonuclease NrnB/cAMP/cGMP phosphodiesterase (DHH superfamily)